MLITTGLSTKFRPTWTNQNCESSEKCVTLMNFSKVSFIFKKWIFLASKLIDTLLYLSLISWTKDEKYLILILFNQSDFDYHFFSVFIDLMKFYPIFIFFKHLNNTPNSCFFKTNFTKFYRSVSQYDTIGYKLNIL